MARDVVKISVLLSTLLMSALASENASAAVSENHENSFAIETAVMVAATLASTWNPRRVAASGRPRPASP